MLTNQEIFDRVRAHLLAQNAKSKTDGLCLYRDAGGRKCAIGCLIADDQYDESFEGRPWYSDAVSRAMPGVDVNASAPLLSDLQRIHDQYAVADWSDALTLLARRFHLTVDPCPTT